MRSPAGYAGPVAHWWSQSLLYTGPGYDWRYEGILAGYLNLYQATGEERWLSKARRAGDDLLDAQLPDGHYPASAFELNPASGGTPHEAACDLGLLLLAHKLKSLGDPAWETYLDCARRNLQKFYLDQLWDPETHSFRDSPTVPSFVPNKAATACEAFFLLAEILDDESWVELYALPNLDRIIAHQVHNKGHLEGAISQNSLRNRLVEKYFPYYIARCVPALVRGYEWTQDERYLESALNAMSFVFRWRYEDGSFPQVIYPNGRLNRYPQWIAAVGDILRAMILLEQYGLDVDPKPSLDWLISGQSPTGGFHTAHGFDSQVSQRAPGIRPEFRDLLPVVGWNDKAFRYLTTLVAEDKVNYSTTTHAFESACTLRGEIMNYREDEKYIEVTRNDNTHYRWRKGDAWAEIAKPEFWLR